MARLRFAFWLLALGALGLAACGATSTMREQQTVDGLSITLERAAAPRLNQNQLFIVSLTDARQRPVEGAELYLDLDMPAMPMGTNQPIATALGNGAYRAETAYTMTGAWTITVVAEVEGREFRAIFNAEVEE